MGEARQDSNLQESASDRYVKDEPSLRDGQILGLSVFTFRHAPQIV